jgi:hypothetical protein
MSWFETAIVAVAVATAKPKSGPATAGAFGRGCKLGPARYVRSFKKPLSLVAILV